jgi:hypothetical protein
MQATSRLKACARPAPTYSRAETRAVARSTDEGNLMMGSGPWHDGLLDCF